MNPTQSHRYCLAITVILLMAIGCKKDQDLPVQGDFEGKINTKWGDMTLQVLRRSYFNTPTYSSRSLGYLGLTQYETVVHSNPSMRSMAGQVNGITTLPLPETGKDYNWKLALNAGQHTLIKLLYPLNENMSPETSMRVDSLHQSLLAEFSAGVDATVVDRSVQYGNTIANAIFEFSKTDGGHTGFKRNFDPSYIRPQGAGYWVPPIRGQTISAFPLHPHWGSNRTFSAANSTLPVPTPVPYSTVPTSENYKFFKAVYDKNGKLTNEEKEIAAWWADDPTETFSPPGHSYNLATIAIRKAGSDVVTAAQAYARTGMAIADAFINCWKIKYTYHSERPSTFINRVIDPTWIPYWPEPPFPAFSSGHSTQSAAAATVMTAIYGSRFSFIDNSHEGATRFSPSLTFRPRKYDNFWASAEESAHSRFLGGIHTQQDNTIGLAEGKKIGENINKFHWNK